MAIFKLFKESRVKTIRNTRDGIEVVYNNDNGTDDNFEYSITRFDFGGQINSIFSRDKKRTEISQFGNRANSRKGKKIL